MQGLVGGPGQGLLLLPGGSTRPGHGRPAEAEHLQTIPVQTMLLPCLNLSPQQRSEEREVDHVAVDGDAKHRHHAVEQPVELLAPHVDEVARLTAT